MAVQNFPNIRFYRDTAGNREIATTSKGAKAGKSFSDELGLMVAGSSTIAIVAGSNTVVSDDSTFGSDGVQAGDYFFAAPSISVPPQLLGIVVSVTDNATVVLDRNVPDDYAGYWIFQTGIWFGPQTGCIAVVETVVDGAGRKVPVVSKMRVPESGDRSKPTNTAVAACVATSPIGLIGTQAPDTIIPSTIDRLNAWPAVFDSDDDIPAFACYYMNPYGYTSQSLPDNTSINFVLARALEAFTIGLSTTLSAGAQVSGGLFI